MTVVLLSFHDNGPVVVLWQRSCCCSIAQVLLSFYDSGPVVILYQCSYCCSMAVVLLLL